MSPFFICDVLSIIHLLRNGVGSLVMENWYLQPTPITWTVSVGGGERGGTYIQDVGKKKKTSGPLEIGSK